MSRRDKLAWQASYSPLCQDILPVAAAETGHHGLSPVSSESPFWKVVIFLMCLPFS